MYRLFRNPELIKGLILYPTKPQKRYICDLFSLLFRLEEDIFQYAKQNLAVVNVYIKDPVVTRILRDEKIPVIAFVANTGGKEFHRSGNI